MAERHEVGSPQNEKGPKLGSGIKWGLAGGGCLVILLIILIILIFIPGMLPPGVLNDDGVGP